MTSSLLTLRKLLEYLSQGDLDLPLTIQQKGDGAVRSFGSTAVTDEHGTTSVYVLYDTLPEGSK